MYKVFLFSFLLIFSVCGLLYSFQQPKYDQTVDGLKKIAEGFNDAEQFDSAAIYYEKARFLAIDSKSKNELHTVLEKELAFWTTRGDLDNSAKRKQFSKFWPEFKEDSKFRQYYYDAQSSLYLYEMNQDSFQYYYEKTVEEIRSNKDWNYLVMYNTFAAQQCFYSDEYDKALKYLKKAEESLALTKDLKSYDLSGYYFVCNELYNAFGEHQLALKNSLICLEILNNKKDDNSGEYATVLNNIAYCYTGLEDFENALKYYEESAKISLKTENPYETSIIYKNIGYCLKNLNRFDEALSSFRKALELSNSSKLNDLKSEIGGYFGIAEVYRKLNMLDSANFYGNKLLELHKEEKRDLETSYNLLGKIALDSKEFDKSKQFFQKSLDIFLKKYGEKNINSSNVLYSLAELYYNQKKYPEGLDFIQRAIAANTYENLDTKDYKKNPDVKNVFDRGMMMNELRLKSIILDSIRVEGKTIIKAVDIYNTAKASVDMLLFTNQNVQKGSKSYWLNDKGDSYFQHAVYYALLAAEEEKDEKYKEEAFLISERSKSILLFESLREKSANKFSAVPDSLIEKENSLKKLALFFEMKKRDALMDNDNGKANILDKKLLEIQIEIDKIYSNIKKNFPEYYQLKYEELKIKPKDIMAKLDDSTIMIEYLQGYTRTFIFVLSKNSFECHQVIADSIVTNKALAFHKIISNFHNSMRKPEQYFKNYKESALELYNLWLKPYLKPNDKGKRLVIINDGTLSYVPFEALLTANVDTKNYNYKNLPYLLKDYIVNYDYSAELWLRHLQAKKQINGRIYGMAPNYSIKANNSESFLSLQRTGKEKNLRSGIGELPGAYKEVSLLKNSFKGFYPSKLNASEKAWKKNASNYGILHFAMHGLINEKEPEYSCLVFAEDGSKDEDNFLYAYEIKQAQLNASMVVLSACETGAGKYQRGEGVLSIGRGFMYAGVPSLVMTLWKLNDQSATDLIEEFYKNLEKGLEKDKALQQAKIKYLENANNISAHPALWACYVQLGDYSAIKIEKVDYFNYLIISVVLGSVLALLIFFYRRLLKSKSQYRANES